MIPSTFPAAFGLGDESLIEDLEQARQFEVLRALFEGGWTALNAGRELEAQVAFDEIVAQGASSSGLFSGFVGGAHFGRAALIEMRRRRGTHSPEVNFHAEVQAALENLEEAIGAGNASMLAYALLMRLYTNASQGNIQEDHRRTWIEKALTLFEECPFSQSATMKQNHALALAYLSRDCVRRWREYLEFNRHSHLFVRHADGETESVGYLEEAREAAAKSLSVLESIDDDVPRELVDEIQRATAEALPEQQAFFRRPRMKWTGHNDRWRERPPGNDAAAISAPDIGRGTQLANIALEALDAGSHAVAQKLALVVCALNTEADSLHSTLARAQCLGILANGEKNKGDLVAAYALAERCLWETKASDPDNRTGNLALAMNHMGAIAHALGRLGEAVSLLEDALGHLNATNSPTQKASILNNLSLVYVELNEIHKAMDLLGQAKTELGDLQLSEGVEGIWTRILVLMNLGRCQWLNSGNPFAGMENAWRGFKLAERFFSDRHDYFCVVQCELAERASMLERMYEALKDIVVVDEDNLDDVTKTLQMDGCSIDMDLLQWLCSIRPSSSEKLFRDAIQLAIDAYGPGHHQHLRPLLELATFSIDCGDIAKAEGLFGEAISAVEAKPSAISLRQISAKFAQLVSCAHARGASSDTVSLVEKLLHIDEQILDTALLSSSEWQRLAIVNNLQSHLDHYLWIVWSHFRNDARTTVRAFEVMLRRHGMATALARKQASIEESRHRSRREKVDRLRRLRRLLADAAVRGAVQEGAQVHSEMERWGREAQRLETEIARESPWTADAERHLENAHVELLKKLGGDGVLAQCRRLRLWNPETSPIESIRTRSFAKPTERYLAFVAGPGPDSTPRMVDVGDGEEIDNLIRTFLAEIRGDPDVGHPGKPERELLDSNAGKALCDRLLKPILEAAPGCRRMYLALDGQLSALPIEALPLNGTFALEQIDIRHLSFGRDLLREQTRSRAVTGKVVVVSAPDFDLSVLGSIARRVKPAKGLVLEPLPSAKVEGRDIVKLLQDGGIETEHISGSQATKSSVMGISYPLVLHLATHAKFFDITSPPRRGRGANPGELFQVSDESEGADPHLRSIIALAGANEFFDGKPTPQSIGNGLLTAAEVATMDLAGTELAVLSACDTGRGVPQIGEGVFGLRRAFEIAGAQSVIMSLWHVEDASTMKLMKNLYRELLAGESRPIALRKAKLNLKSGGADPWVWAAFIYVGKDEPVHWNSRLRS